MIRRGLDALEGEGLIKRVYGGATSNRGRSHAPPFFLRKSKSAEVQERIDRRAAELTTCGHNVALDVGTTTLQIPGHPDDKRSLTIVTPNSPIANVLIGQPDLRHETVGRLLDLGIEVILA